MHRAAVLLLMAAPLASLGAQQWTVQDSHTATEFRALFAVDAHTIWAAGKGGVVSHSSDGGASWQPDSIPGARGLFLVGVHALDGRQAFVVGTAFDGAALGRVYYTRDAGNSWVAQYENDHKGVFLDGMAFWDRSHGIAFGDPIDGELMLLTTDDGHGWSQHPRNRLPALLSGEAAFAASGTAIRTAGKSDVWIGTGGGEHARVLHSSDRGKTWTASATPASGSASKGIFGIAAGERGRMVAVGGDYRQRDASVENLLLSDDGGRSWRLAQSPGLIGVQYGVAYAGHGRFVAVGPGGSSFSSDNGASWSRLEGGGFNTVSCVPSGCWAAGVGGRIAKLSF